jgi:prolyl 4-hydroxylase
MNKEFPKKIADNVTMHSADPILYEVHDFLSNDECDAFLKASKGKLKSSTVISSGEAMQHENRTSENCWIEHDANEIVHEVSKRLSILVQMPIRNAEQYQLVYYKKGTEYKPHFDSFDYETKEGKKNWEPGGQRMITVLAYLNDPKEGGETNFPQIGTSINAKKGNIVVFHNTLPITSTTNHPKIHPRSLHSGMPVIKGEKWMVNLWFRENLRY